MDYDLAIIGAGWAGVNAALKAKESGLKVALIEKQELGGTCLNRGCIPTKALIHSAKIYSSVKKSKVFGVETGTPGINFTEVQKRKDKVVQQLRQGIEFMLKGVDVIREEARLTQANTIQAGQKSISAEYILIATGSKPFQLPGLKFDAKKILSSDDILNLKSIPESLLIIGGGVIGCEFASLFSQLGTQVSIVEKFPQLLPGEDAEVARKIEVIFKKKGMKINTGTDATTVDINNYSLSLLCVGRIPDVGNLGLEAAGIKLDRGKVVVDEYLRTNIPNIYAAGDITGKFMLAHFAAYQGGIVAENIAHPDNLKKADNPNVPSCIFTDPEISSVGLNEEKAKAKGIDVEVRRFDFLASGMGRIMDETDGFIKIISEKDGKVCGACIIGPRATELIATLTVAISAGLKVSQLRDTIFAHPTLSESIHEAAQK